MILCLDIGNTQIFGGLYKDEKQIFQFRYTSSKHCSSDEVGLFLRNVIRENQCKPEDVKHIGICTVVPQTLYSIRNACIKYFNQKPFVLEAGVKTGLKIKYKNPLEVGADRIANAIAASQLYPGKNLIVADFGTATTFCAITKEKDYLGGVIMPGLKLSMEALESKTAKLPSVEIVRPQDLIGRTTVSSIQSGLFYGNYFAVKGIVEEIKKQYFAGDENTIVIGTGGFSRLFDDSKVFGLIDSDLVLKGIHLALKMNL